MKKSRFLAILLLTSLFALSACNNGGTEEKKDDEQHETVVSLTRLEITAQPTKTTYYVDESFDISGLEVTAYYSDNSHKVINNKDLSYDRGAFTEAGPKEVILTYEGKSVSLSVTVLEKVVVTGIVITSEPVVLEYEQNDTFSTEGLVVSKTLSAGEPVALDASEYVVSEPDMSQLGEQEVTITFGDFTASFTINIVEATGGYKVTLNKHQTTVMMEHHETLVATIKPAPDNQYARASFKSDNTDIATIDSDGVIYPMAIGECDITATYQEGTDTCHVTIAPWTENDFVHVAKIQIDNQSVVLDGIGDTEQLSISYIPTNSSEKGITWTSKNKDVATVDSNGVVTAVSSGSAIIVATSKDSTKKTDMINVVVKDNTIDYGYNHYDGYYGELTWTDSEDLKDKLYDIIHDGYQAIDYKKGSSNWETNQFADQDLYNHDHVDLVYANFTQPKTMTYNSGSGWQREHAFAASLMTGLDTGAAVNTLGRATDFHNLFAAYNIGNGSRQNKNFGYANHDSASYQEREDYSFDNKNFEPSDYDKGRLARAIFYMGVMYSQTENVNYQPITIHEEYVEYDSANCAYAIGNLSTLIEWNSFAVDYLEIQHNESVYSHLNTLIGSNQGNRNPFVDYPELVEYVYGSLKDQSGDLRRLQPSEVSLDMTNESAHHYAVKDVKTSYSVGDVFNSSRYTLVEVSHSLIEKSASSSDDLTVPYTFTDSDIGNKVVTVKTTINDIKLDVKVEAAGLESCKYHYIYDKSADSPLSKFVGGKSQTANLNGKNWVFTPPSNDVAISRQNAGLRIGTSTGTADGMTIESTDSFSNINLILLKMNSSSGATFKVKVYVNDVLVDTLTITYNAGESLLYQPQLNSTLTGKVKLELNDVTGSIYLAGIGVNYD